MHVAVLVPGIMGTRLFLPGAASGDEDEQVWPPSALEVAFGYKKIDELQSDKLVTGGVIDSVACFGFYSHIQGQLDQLGYRLGTGDSHRVDFAYDWRKNNFDTARLLAAVIAKEHAAGATEFSLVCHSMGGLVARLLLESGEFKAEPWFSKIKLVATLGTPHLGAPLALARIFGLDSSSGISGKDFRELAANPQYPSGYQLIPAPGEAAIWSTESADLAPLDPYDDATATALGMDPKLVAQAKAQYDALSGIPPAGVRYFYFGGTGHQTVTRLNVVWKNGQPVNHAQSLITKTADGGDGTVPLYSALPARGQRQIVTNEHATVFKGTPFRKVFFRLLGGDAGAALEAALDAAPKDMTVLAGSLDSPVYVEGDRPELRLSVQSRASADGLSATQRIEGTLIVERTDDMGVAEAPVSETRVSYSGAEIAGLTVMLAMMTEAGLYRLSFEGTPAMTEPLAFAVARE